jgi:hypothetical protein
VIAVAAVAGFLIWLFVIREDETTAPVTGSEPVTVSEDELVQVAADVGHPVYWIGPQEGTELEVTTLDDGRVYVRYLDKGAQAGDPRPQFFTVGSYPLDDPYQALKDVAEQVGAIVKKTPDDELVVTNENTPNSVYIASKDSEVQVEVYDPDPDRALEIATSGAVQPVE